MSGVQHISSSSSTVRIHGSLLVVTGHGGLHHELVADLAAVSQQYQTAASGAEAMRAVEEHHPDVVLLPEQLSDMSGMDWLVELKTRTRACDVVMVVGEDGLERGAQALTQGAVDFLIEPAGFDQIAATLALAVKSRGLQSENEHLQCQLRDFRNGLAMLGHSPAARRFAGAVARVAENSSTVMIEGRSGSGKTLTAQVIHASSRRSDRPLRSEHCELITLTWLVEELATTHGGVLLLEDIENLATDCQSRLVQHLKQSNGRDHVRVIATSSEFLPERVARGTFREDLYYRLNMSPVVVPSLKERCGDIAVLADHFLRLASMESETSPGGFTRDAIMALEDCDWPGNVAQLQDVIYRANTLARGAMIDRHHLHGSATGIAMPPVAKASAGLPDLEEEAVCEEDILPFEAEEKRVLTRALRATKGNVRRAAQLLRIGRATLYRKIQIYKLKLN
jgi:DNA-binding NtrC family response regulator